MRPRLLVPAESAKAFDELLSGRVPEIPVLTIPKQREWPRRPDHVNLVMGKPLFEKARAFLPIAKNASLTASREQVFAAPEGDKYLFTFDPYQAWTEPVKAGDWWWDLRSFSRYVRTGQLRPGGLGEYHYVEDFSEVVDHVDMRGSRGVWSTLSNDLETIGLDPFAPQARVVTIAISYKDRHSLVYRVPEDGFPSAQVLDQLKWLANYPLVRFIGANFKFDLGWYQLLGITFSSFRFDTHLVGSLLDENRSNSLETHAKVYTAMGGYDIEFNRRHRKERMDVALKEDPEGFLTYAGGDTDACRRVAKPMRQKLTDDRRLLRFYERILHPASLVFAKMEQRGIVVDQARYTALEVECKEDYTKLEAQALAMLSQAVRDKFKDDLKIKPRVVMAQLFSKRGLGLKPRMRTPKSREPSTNKEHLQMFLEHPEAGPFIELLQERSSASSTLKTYIRGFQKHIRSDGRFHPTYRLGRGADREKSGAVTGRTSATDPAYQTIVKRGKWAKPLRSVYVCPPGYGILKLDENQGELRMTACIANEPTMIQIYRNNQDMHARTAAGMLRVSPEKFLLLKESSRKAGRQAAKPVNFGLIYRMSAEGLQRSSRNSYGVDMTEEDAERYIETFFRTYQGIGPWHEKMIRLARQHGQVRNPFGRIRHLPLINCPIWKIASLVERQAINSPVQGGLSDLVQLAMVELDHRWPDLWIFGMTHDSLEMYLKLDTFMEQAREIKSIMENLPLSAFDWHPPVRFLVDAEAALTGSLADVQELKL